MVRVQNRAQLEGLLEARLAERSRETWIAELRAANVPCGLVQTTAEVIDAEIALGTGLVAEGADGVKMVGSPIRIGGVRAPFGRPAPGLGEHTDEVLAELGLSMEQIAILRARGVVA
jgi:crotonobetainyl-CoA:carnitine CoA-transferase CaiB-like acyl-CoA transferase